MGPIMEIEEYSSQHKDHANRVQRRRMMGVDVTTQTGRARRLEMRLHQAGYEKFGSVPRGYALLTNTCRRKINWCNQQTHVHLEKWPLKWCVCARAGSGYHCNPEDMTTLV